MIHRTRLTSLRQAAYLAGSLTLASCSTSKIADNVNPTGGGAGGANGAPAWILGPWNGLYQNRQPDGASSLREANARATFDGNGEGSGSFTFELPQLDKVVVKGTYRDFAHKSLMLTITESNLSAIGLAGTTTDLPYELIGNALELKNERFALKLTRQDGTQPTPGGNTPANGGQPAPQSLVGAWSCQDSNQYVWRVVIADDPSFTAEVADPKGNLRSIGLTGKSELLNPAKTAARLTVTGSDVDRYVGMLLDARIDSADAMTLTRLDQTNVSPMSCRRGRH